MAGSSLPRHRAYDVFLSFRGVDTRRGIVSHLNSTLRGMGIITFIDDRGLEMGDHISEELRKAIECSRFAIVVLSESYATSKWCLMELQLIMELMRAKRLEVFPIFYDIDPSSVRNHRGSFSLEMYNDQEIASQKVTKWLEALNQIANLSGKVSMDCIDEGTMVRDVARYISRRVTLMRKIDTENFVGVKAHVNAISTMLDLNSNEVGLIQGIWGMGGIGKTTIAKCLFDKLSPEFSARCFLENIRRHCKDDFDDDLVHLQKQLLNSIFPTCDDFELWSVEAGCVEIKSRLADKKVLVLLDGVDNVTQVQALAENTSWFGPGSRIIITTRDKGLLTRCGVGTIHEVTCLDDKDSLRMFQQIAFKGESPPDGLEQLIERASRLAHGLPSALQVYALFFSGMIFDSPEEWEESVCVLERNLDEDIMKILKVSYDGLSAPTKKAFLHVACLFNSDTLSRVVSLLGDKPGASLWIRILQEKSLIKISPNECVIMHKLVEKMGREIMHNCGKFLWDAEEIRDALITENGRGEIECVSLHTYDLSLTTNFVYHMPNLKFLKIYKHLDLEDAKSMPQLIKGIKPLTNHKIRLFHWDAYPFTSFPSCTYLSRLVELNLRHSNLVKLWSGNLVFTNLKRLDATGSKYLRELPNLSNIDTLDELIMEHCMSLEGISKSIGRKSKLKKLKLSYFDKRKRPLIVRIVEFPDALRIELSFPDSSVRLTELMHLSIDGDIQVFLGTSFQRYDADYLSFTSEQQRHVTSEMSAQQARLPSLEFQFNKINSFIITRSSHRYLSTPITTFTSSTELFHHLKELKLINLNIQEITYRIHHLKFIERLDLSGNGFETLPEDMVSLDRLKTLWLRNCYNLKQLPRLTQVQTLTLSNCTNLISLVDLSHSSSHLESYCLLELCLENCNNVESLSDQLKYFKRLTYLNLSSHEFVTLPSSIRDLTSLVTLRVNNCKNLLSLEELPLSLQFLDALDCDSLRVDSAQYFKCKQNKEAIPRNACFEETEIPCYVSKHQTTRSHRNIYLPEITDVCKFISIPIFIMLIAIVIILLRQ